MTSHCAVKCHVNTKSRTFDQNVIRRSGESSACLVLARLDGNRVISTRERREVANYYIGARVWIDAVCVGRINRRRVGDVFE